MKSYLDVLDKILKEGTIKEPARENMPSTIGVSHAVISHDLSEGFPLLTTKKMFWKGIVHELLWFLRGDTNIKYLVDNKVNIWNQDAYRWYLKHAELNSPSPTQNNIMQLNADGSYRMYTLEEFIEVVKLFDYMPAFEYEHETYYKLGDLGKVYGHQWRNQNGVDQVAETFKSLQENPLSRYHIIDGWNKADFPEMALPPCHLLYQFVCRNSPMGYSLDLNMYQRSCDTVLGVPFNVASMGLLNMLFAKALGMTPGVINWIGGDTHLYEDHISAAELQLTREPFKQPNLIFKDVHSLEDILNLTIDDFELVDYKSHDPIKVKLSTGL